MPSRVRWMSALPLEIWPNVALFVAPVHRIRLYAAAKDLRTYGKQDSTLAAAVDIAQKFLRLEGGGGDQQKAIAASLQGFRIETLPVPVVPEDEEDHATLRQCSEANLDAVTGFLPTLNFYACGLLSNFRYPHRLPIEQASELVSSAQLALERCCIREEERGWPSAVEHLHLGHPKFASDTGIGSHTTTASCSSNVTVPTVANFLSSLAEIIEDGRLPRSVRNLTLRPESRVSYCCDELNQVMSALASNCTLTMVDLTACGLGNEHGPVLQEIFSCNAALKRLTLARNCIGGQEGAVHAMLAAIEGTRLEHLDLSMNLLDDSDAVVIGKTLETNRSLLTLDLSQNRIVATPGREVLRGAGLVSIWQALKLNRHIRSLNFQSQISVVAAKDEDMSPQAAVTHISKCGPSRRSREKAERDELRAVIRLKDPEQRKVAHDAYLEKRGQQKVERERQKKADQDRDRAELSSVMIEVRPEKAAMQLSDGHLHHGRLLIAGPSESKKISHTCTKPQAKKVKNRRS